MKRHLAALALALAAAPAFAVEVGAPYDQSLIDRQLPNIELRTVEQRDQYAAAAGSTRSDVEISTVEAPASSGSGLASGPWANDYHFIAPAQ